MNFIKLMILAAALVLTGCSSQPYRGDRETSGQLVGAALGGLLGAQFGSGGGALAATAVGVLIGSLIGSDIGHTLDEVDRMHANEAVNKAHNAELGEQITWNNPESGHYGSVTPTRDGTAETGAYCREFYETVSIGGKTEEAYGVACQQPDGTWRIVQ